MIQRLNIQYTGQEKQAGFELAFKPSLEAKTFREV